METVLFSIVQGADGKVIVESWDYGNKVLRTEAQVESYLRKVALAKQTREVIERLMLVGPEP